ncbi:complex I NDUFA9 subunit family protein [Rhodoplanes sp. TEM]|uniref:Complex I NDUFA9 subunit family protein n=2 Tax=Rhodoplanes TaxID=29407 RepID=A0ABT5J454_RHOTP|nr:complex I NDUFA9 subunit family protein [Rhodoplanes tepidamans]MDC7784206.1 complex I NDUFA9 subunit family protein [Rhodoplanes tepidamans]MDC7988055.1 complex I NDUFA9 subunit family protein [Rhodoplanes sp. TEM]MDQ0356696.1 NADH dehydrogenase [Rhodoplanes tepidamans]
MAMSTPTSSSDALVTIFGGSGFLGRHVVRALAPELHRMRIAVRRPDLTGHLQPLGRVGQIHAVQANLRNADSVASAVRDAGVVINLVGILFERGKQSFEAVHVEGAATVARAAAAQGARLIHVSAIGADPDSSALYARTKGQAEAAVLVEAPDAVILRPSVIFGPDDAFFNKFAAMARIAPALPLIGGGRTRFQPVFGGDVAEAVRKAVDGEVAPGIYELGGPDVATFKELMRLVLDITQRRRLLLPVPFWAAKLLGAVLKILPNPPLTPDQVELLKADNVVSEAAIRENRTLAGLGIEAHTMAAVVPSYLWRYRKAGQFTGRRSLA